MANTIEITVKANDQASGTLGKIAGEAKGLGAILKTQLLGDLANVAGRAFDGITRSVGGALKETQAYAQSIKDLSNLTGATMEESSRLVNVADDLKIEAGSLQTALEAATRKGFDPSAESLAKLSDQYLRLQPGMQRSQFLMETFGRSGMDLAEIMKLGGAAIREQAGAVDDSLIISEEAYQKTRDYERAMDDLNDSLLGVKNEFMQALLPVMKDFVAILKDTIMPALKGMLDVFNALPQGGQQAVIGIGAVGFAVLGLAEPVLGLVKTFKELQILFGAQGVFAAGAAGANALAASLLPVAIEIGLIVAGLKFIADNFGAAEDTIRMAGAVTQYKMGILSDQDMLQVNSIVNQKRNARAESGLGVLSLERIFGFGAGAQGNTTININTPINMATMDDAKKALTPIVQDINRGQR